MTKLAEILTAHNYTPGTTKPVVFLGGLCKSNDWREELVKEFPGLLLLSPYDEDWEIGVNIYEELAGILQAHHVLFYKGGKFTEREKAFCDDMKKSYKEFDSLDSVKAELRKIAGPAEEPVSESGPRGLAAALDNAQTLLAAYATCTECRWVGSDARSKAAGDADEDRCLNRLGGTDYEGNAIKQGGVCPYHPADWQGADIHCKNYEGV